MVLRLCAQRLGGDDLRDLLATAQGASVAPAVFFPFLLWCNSAAQGGLNKKTAAQSKSTGSDPDVLVSPFWSMFSHGLKR